MKEIKKSKIIELIRHLEKKYDVFLPVQKGDNWVFGKLSYDVGIMNLKPVLTVLPPKKYLNADGEQVYSSKEGEIYYSENNTKPLALFGVNSFDINALKLLDQIMNRPVSEPNYLKKRKNMIVVGVGPERINLASSGYDIFLEEYENEYLAIAGTPAGSEILEWKIFDNSKKKPKKILSFNDPVLSQSDKIKKAIEKSYGAKIWQDLAKTCLGCGICAYVCPLCYCNEFEDSFEHTSEVSNSRCKSCRRKRWDACFLPDFFQVAGHNNRENLSDRIYNWYHHKFVRMPEEYGHMGCVDCGRCIEFCPAKINFKKVLKELIK